MSTSPFQRHADTLEALHGIIRNAGEKIKELAPRIPADQRVDFVKYVTVYVMYIHNHHETEDTVMIPLYQATKLPMLKLQEEHKALAPQLDTMMGKLREWEDDPESYNADELVQGVRAIEALLLPHLQLEEDALSPKILEDSCSAELVTKVMQGCKGHGMKSDGNYSLPFMYYNMSEKTREHFWVEEFPWILRRFVFPYILAPTHKRLWKFTKFPPA